MHDVIVVGTRVAGAATAMLLARAGLDVLAVDRAAFPSDTLSTHQIQVPGVAALRRWGLADELVARNTPPARSVRFDAGFAVLDGRLPDVDGADAILSPRRTRLDALLVGAARAAGAEVRERFAVEELCFQDGRVAGIRGRESTVRARVVVGADGRHSRVAKLVRAVAYRTHEARSVGYYAYWDGLPLAGGEMYARGDRIVGAWPTDDSLTITYVAAPRDAFGAFRADPEGELLRALDRCGDLGERARAARRAERVFGTADTQNRFHVPHGDGWALVGDAGLVMDPVTGQGIAHAFRDAELLSAALVDGLGGARPLGAALAQYREARDRATSDMYDMTLDLVRFAPPGPEQELLLAALADRPEEITRFLGAITGALPAADVFGPRALLRLLGLRGMLKAGRARRRVAA